MPVSTQFRCLQCGRLLQAISAQPGQTIPCPGCKTYVTVPRADASGIPAVWGVALIGAVIAVPLLFLGVALIAILIVSSPTANTPNPEPQSVAKVVPSVESRTEPAKPRVVTLAPETPPVQPEPNRVGNEPARTPEPPPTSEPIKAPESKPEPQPTPEPTPPSEPVPPPVPETPPEPPAVVPSPPRAPTGADRAKELDVIRHSALAAVIDANGGRVPATGEELNRALTSLGMVHQLPVSFSSVALDSGLANPRVVFAPTTKPEVGAMGFGGGFGGMSGGISGGGGWSAATAEGPGRSSSVSEAAVNTNDLTGRLFLAANMEKTENGTARVRSVEFISWNSQRKRYDFGIIENMGGGGRSELHVVDGVKCFSCHKTKGPILGGGPWSNTTHNSLLRTSASELFGAANVAPAPGQFPGGIGFGPAGLGLNAPAANRFDGIDILSAQAFKVDEHVRLGAERLRNREAFRLMTRTPNGPKALTLLMTGLVTPATTTPPPGGRPERGRLPGFGVGVQREAVPLAKIDQDFKTRIDQAFSSTNFSVHWQGYQKVAASSILRDFSPAGPPPTRPGTEWGGTPALVKKYDQSRAETPVILPSDRVPSNPRAFLKQPVGAPLRASSTVSVTRLAETIGTSEGDRDFLARMLLTAEAQVARPKVTAAILATAVFEGPAFADVLKSGTLPDRDEFKDRFLTGLKEVLRTKYELGDALAFDRKDYASTPEFKPGVEEEEPVLVPTTACLRCHDVRPQGKGKLTEPLPSLAFDPFDKKSREDWVRTANPQRKEQVLSRMLKRLAEDKDMPPEDEPEHEKFRMGNPASFEAAQQFLEAELKKLRGS